MAEVFTPDPKPKDAATSNDATGEKVARKDALIAWAEGCRDKQGCVESDGPKDAATSEDVFGCIYKHLHVLICSRRCANKSDIIGIVLCTDVFESRFLCSNIMFRLGGP